MDNLSSHKGPEIERMLRQVGAELWFLPPYSPEMDPIEKMWSKVKETLRSIKARCTEERYEAVRQALSQVTADDAKGWLESCEYRYEKR